MSRHAEREYVGNPTIVIPGLGTNAVAVMPLCNRLRAQNLYVAHSRAGVVRGLVVPGRLGTETDKIGDRIMELSDRFQKPVNLVGYSYGSTLAEINAIRDPELVDTVVTVAGLHADDLLDAIRIFGPGFKATLFMRPDLRKFRDELAEPFPEDVKLVHIFSERDRITQHKHCHRPAAKHIELAHGHSRIPFSPEAADAAVGELMPPNQTIRSTRSKTVPGMPSRLASEDV